MRSRGRRSQGGGNRKKPILNVEQNRSEFAPKARSVEATEQLAVILEAGAISRFEGGALRYPERQARRPSPDSKGDHPEQLY